MVAWSFFLIFPLWNFCIVFAVLYLSSNNFKVSDNSFFSTFRDNHLEPLSSCWQNFVVSYTKMQNNKKGKPTQAQYALFQSKNWEHQPTVIQIKRFAFKRKKKNQTQQQSSIQQKVKNRLEKRKFEKCKSECDRYRNWNYT